MGTVTIDVKVEIFDDAEYCENESGRCYFLEPEGEDHCVLFDEFLGHIALYLKCPQCKAAYAVAKTTKKTADDYFWEAMQ